MTRGRWWTIIGLVIALVTGVLVAVLQINGIIDDPARLGCDIAAGRADCE